MRQLAASICFAVWAVLRTDLSEVVFRSLQASISIRNADTHMRVIITPSSLSGTSVSCRVPNSQLCLAMQSCGYLQAARPVSRSQHIVVRDARLVMIQSGISFLILVG